MTEADWLASTDPAAMLSFITEPLHQPFEAHRVGASDRKLRLFAVACCRQVWDQLTDERSRGAVETAERYVDERATEAELLGARQAAEISALWQGVSHLPAVVACGVPLSVASLTSPAVEPWLCSRAALLREIFGNPWQPVRHSVGLPGHTLMNIIGDHCFPDTWLAWNDRTVPRLAEAIYEGRRFEELPILADALEESGCENEELLRHCRGLCEPGTAGGFLGPHVRGCWAVDLLLGKE